MYIHKYNKQLPCLMNYTPNYNAIYCNKLILQKCKKDLKFEKVWKKNDKYERKIRKSCV